MLEDLTAEEEAARRRKFHREFWRIREAEEEPWRGWGASLSRGWEFRAAQMVEKLKGEREGVLAYLGGPARWRHRLRTTNLAEGFFRALRRYLGRFPGCVNPAHSEHVLGCFILACEQAHA